jgi:hypothetical protein
MPGAHMLNFVLFATRLFDQELLRAAKVDSVYFRRLGGLQKQL